MKQAWTGVTQIRIRFNLPSNSNNLADYDTFYGGDAASLVNRPILRVEYTVPINP